MEILKTTQYSLFNLSELNRVVNETHVRELMTSIQESNLLQYSPIIVNKHMEVIDGQHRLEAAKRLKTEVFYVVSDTATVKETRLLNRANKNWNLVDFVRSYALAGDKKFQVLGQFVETYGLPVSVAMELVTIGTKSRSFSKQVRDGNLSLGDIEMAHKLAMRMIKLRQYTENGEVIKSRAMIRALLRLETVKIPYQLIIEKLDESGWKLRRAFVYKDILRQFEDVINYKLKKNKTRLY